MAHRTRAAAQQLAEPVERLGLILHETVLVARRARLVEGLLNCVGTPLKGFVVVGAVSGVVGRDREQRGLLELRPCTRVGDVGGDARVWHRVRGRARWR